jgi:4-deoxy-L-threo-5-hexosulose-uronate ketol-isomerase
MDVRFAPNPNITKTLPTEQLRKEFLIESVFVPGKATMLYSDVDRAVIGGVAPTDSSVELLASKKEMAAEYFCERREIGILNIGGSGTITADGKTYTMELKDVLYIGKGIKTISFTSDSKEAPALFYFISYPAHTSYPVAHSKFSQAEPQKLGSEKDSNKRTIYKYIHPNGIKSCQLVMGMTELDEGSIWNTMPSHTHLRRSEVYLYFNLKNDAVIFHMMGEPNETRHLVIRNQQAVISPSWSIHSGAGTSNYSFIWAMGGENQEFGDMDVVPMTGLL